MRNKITSVIFCLIIILSIVISLLVPDKLYSDSEKRLLTQIKDISLVDFYSGKMGEEIENYLTDQFPLRDDFITIKTIMERLLGKKEIADVYFCDDGYLISKFDSYDETIFKGNVNLIINLVDKLNSLNIPVKTMLVPTSSYILKDKLPKYASTVNQRDLLEYVKSQNIDVIDTFDILESHKDEYIYYKTDHHYTSLGAYYCYVTYSKALNKEAEEIDNYNSAILCTDFLGTIYNKVNYPFVKADYITAYYKSLNHKVNYNNGYYETDCIYEMKYLNGNDQYSTFLNSNQASCVIESEGKGNLLIIKDSFANCFAQFVIDDYNQTHLIDPRFYKDDIIEYIKANEITEVLILYNIENFANNVIELNY